MWQVLQNPDVLKIGIQIRTKDDILRGGEDPLNITERSTFFECAQEIEYSRARPGQQVTVIGRVHLRGLNIL